MLEIILKRPVMLGLGPNVPTLKPGNHHIEDRYQNEWWFEALVASGDIVVKDPSLTPRPEKTAMVNIPAQGPVLVSIVEEPASQTGEENATETSEEKNPASPAEGVKVLSRTSEEAEESSVEVAEPKIETAKKARRFTKAKK